MIKHCDTCPNKALCETEWICLKAYAASKPTADPALKIAVLEGEQELHHDEIGWWAKELDFWRLKYLKEHPELDNWEYVRNARKDEGESGF